jgi:hypothetical protein
MLTALLPFTIGTASADDRYLEINEENFPDFVFRQWIVDNLDVSGDAESGYYMTEEQVYAVQEITCWNSGISSLQGIAYFTELDYLNCCDNNLTELDVSKNTMLQELYCFDNQLTALDVSKNKVLQILECNDNQIGALDVTKNTELTNLILDNNQVGSLDVSKCPELTILYADSNGLSALDVSKNPKLEELTFNDNPVGAIDISNNPALLALSCVSCGLTDLDLSNAPHLFYVHCSNNQLTQLDVTHNPELVDLACDDNQLTALDVSKCPELTILNADNNGLSALDVSKCPELKVLYVDNNGLTQLDVSKNNKLEKLSFSENFIGTIDISNNSALTMLSCAYCELTELDLSNAPHLLQVVCFENQLTALDVTHNPELVNLDCDCNQLTALDLSRNPALLRLYCGDNRLPWLDLSNNTNINARYLGIRSQSIYDQTGALADRTYTYDLTQLVPKARLGNVTLQNTAYQLNASTGVVTFPSRVDSFTYLYSTEYGDMDVTVHLSFAGDAIPVLDGIVEWNKNDVKFKGTTAYVIANGKAQTPRFTVKDADGSVIDAQFYDFEYKENTKAGTGYVFVTFKNGYEGTCRGTFKIYLQPTSTTTVANVKDGIKLTWSKVAGADGYVIYRRAWSSTTNGWTDFVRWNNTKELNWLDKTVYAGTRYQYGIKAYFNKRLDPVAGVEIGGNVGDNYNLGEVGPLKTTVRITTRTLNSVTAGTKQMTVKWGASSQFTGYQIQYATNSAFTQNAKAIKIANPKTSSTVIKSLLSGKTYYVRVRSYHEFNGMTYYGEWSNVKSCKVK